MTIALTRSLSHIVAGALFAMTATSSFAQDSTNQVANNGDWYVFEDNSSGKQCWAVAKPKSTVNTDGAGKSKSVTRGEILLFVSYAPAAGMKGQISFQGGYPFAPGSEVTMTIGGTNYSLFSEGETAWSTSPEADAQIVAAMKRGAEATLTGRSARDTVTKDTFSLSGVTASIDDAAARCAN